MTDILLIGGAHAVELNDRSLFAGYTSSDDTINRQVDYTATGCFGTSGKSAVLRKAKTLGWTRRYLLYATGANMDAALVTMALMRTEIIAAEKYNMGITATGDDGIVPYPAWVVRRLKDMARPQVWTILFGSISETQSNLLSLDEIRVCGTMELFIMLGAENLDEFGFPFKS